MDQLSFASLDFAAKKKRTKRDVFLGEMAVVVPWAALEAVIEWLLGQEDRMGLHTVRPYREFEERVYLRRDDLRRLLQALVADGKRVLGYRASTKGNVLLQPSASTTALILAFNRRTPAQYRRTTPGTTFKIDRVCGATIGLQPDCGPSHRQ